MVAAAAAAKSLQSCPTLCDPIDGSPPGSPIPGILQARALEWVAISFSQCMKGKSESEAAQSCLTLSDPMDYSPPGSSIHGIFQARVLEWGAISFSVPHCRQILLPSEPPGKPKRKADTSRLMLMPITWMRCVKAQTRRCHSTQ